MIEEWRPISEFPQYAVSNMGGIKRIISKGGKPTDRPLAAPPNHDGYRAVVLCVEGKHYTRRVHTLIAQTFIGPKPTENHQVAHWDGNKLNNVVSNLRWATVRENADDRLRHGTTARGERQARAYLTEAAVADILASQLSGSELAAKHKTGRNNIYSIRRRLTWKHVQTQPQGAVRHG